MSGEAMQMRWRLARLAQQHRLALPEPCILPLSEPVDGPVIIEGIAAATSVDLERTRFRRYAFPILPWSKDFPPLLFRHTEQVAGEVVSLEYDTEGQLRVRAVVDHPLAKRCAGLSVSARVIEYEICDADSESYSSRCCRT
jgi:hypothetical protein